MKILLRNRRELLLKAAELVFGTLREASGLERASRLEVMALLLELAGERVLSHKAEHLARECGLQECRFALFIESYQEGIKK